MSRRRKAEKRKILEDPVYHSVTLAKFINKVMEKGKKSIAKKIVYNALEKFAKKVKIEKPLEAFNQVLVNARPSLEVKSKRIGGATYQVPIEIAQDRKTSLAIKWIITHAKAKSGKSMVDGLIIEFYDCFNNQGATIKKKEDMHRMAEANKAFAHFR